MARYSKDFPAPDFPKSLFDTITQYLASEGYSYTQFQNEQIFKKGHGLVSAPSFIKVFYANNAIRVESWIKYALLPGVYFSEMDLEGFTGSAVKAPLRKRVAIVEDIIMQYTNNLSSGRPVNIPSSGVNTSFSQPQASTKHCTNCGARIDSNADFCGYCGSRQ